MVNLHSLVCLLCISAFSPLAYSAETCSRDPSVQNAVVAWLTKSCGADAPIPEIGRVKRSNLPTSNSPTPLSCPSLPSNSKCYPIWERDHADDLLVDSRQPDSLLDYKTQPILRQSAQQMPLGYNAHSVTLRWPDGMKHAIFYVDDACQELSTRRPELSWHVTRHETQSKQCETIPEGLFKSIEFMRQDEYEIFWKRVQGKDDGIGGAIWRGIF